MAYFPQFGMQQQMGMAPMQRQMQQYRPQPFQGFQGMQGLQGLQRLLGGLGGREDFAFPGTGRSAPLGGGLSLIGQLQDPQARQGLMDQYKQQLDDRRNNLQKDYGTYSAEEIAAKLREDPTIYTAQEQRSLPQPLGQGIGGREDIALPGTGQTQPSPMQTTMPPGSALRGTPEAMQRDHRVRSEDLMQRDEKQRAMPQGLGQGIGGREDFALPGTGQTQPPPMQTTPPAQPTPLKGAPPLTPTKIPPGTGGVKPAQPPASTPPPPGQIGGPAPVQPLSTSPPPPQQQQPAPPPPGQTTGSGGIDFSTFDPGWEEELRDGPTIPGPDYDFLMGRDTPVSDFGGGRWGSIHDVPRSPWGRGPSRRQPFPSFPPMMPRFGGGMPRGMGMPYGGGGPYGNLWGGGGGGGFGGGWGQPQMPRFGGGFGGGMRGGYGGGMGGGYGGGMGGIGGFPGMGGGGYGGGFGGGYGMPQMPRFGGGMGGGYGGGFGGGMPRFGGGMGGGYGGGFGGGMPNYGMQQLHGGGW